MNPNTNNANVNNPNNPGRPITGADIPLMLKARYFGSGLVVGVFLSEPVKGLVSKLTKQVEGFTEKGSEILSQAKNAINTKKDDCCDEGEKCESAGNA